MAISCDGGGEGVSIDGAVTATKNQSALTGMIWVRPRSLPATDTKFIDYSIFNGTNARYTLQYDSATPGVPFVGGRATDGEGLKQVDGTQAIVVGQWTHIIGVLDYANSLGMIYINGVLNVALSVTSPPFAAAQTANTNSENSSGSGGGIGVRVNATQSFIGDIEDMRLYNRVIGPAEAMTIYAALGEDGIQNGLLHRFPMNDYGPGTVVGDGTVVNIAEFERVDGSVMAGTPTYVEGIIRSARKRQGRSRSGRA